MSSNEIKDDSHKERETTPDDLESEDTSEEDLFDDEEPDIPFDAYAPTAPTESKSGPNLLKQIELNERAAARWQSVREVAQGIKALDTKELLLHQEFLVVPASWDRIRAHLITHPLFSTLFETSFVSSRHYLRSQLQAHDCLLPTATISDVRLTPEDWENYLHIGPFDFQTDDMRNTPDRWSSFSRVLQACMDIDVLIMDESSALVGNTIITNEELEIIAEEFWGREAGYLECAMRYRAWLNEGGEGVWEVVKMRREVCEQLLAEQSWR